ncbi:MAG: 50S ribosomal protein L11 methyltransferase [Oleibacter sp.]|nr:50S ribosomal protein L11 methyltransferase [Thalassolituus sp.]
MTTNSLLFTLEQRLKNMLYDAQLVQQTLPQCPQIKLWLLDPIPMQRAFSAEEVESIETYPAYWAMCWASGQILARHVSANPDIVAGKRVLDFGSGSGVVAIAAALAGATEVVALDQDADALLACQANAQLNHVELNTTSKLLEFETPFDLLLVADVLYDRDNLSLLDQFLGMATNVLLADSRVHNFQHPHYVLMNTEESATHPDLDEANDFRRVRIYRSEQSPLEGLR